MNWLKLVCLYMPAVLQTVTSVESALHGTPGNTKKQVALDIIKAGSQLGQNIPDERVQDISKMIDMVVSTLNATGVFATSKNPTPAK